MQVSLIGLRHLEQAKISDFSATAKWWIGTDGGHDPFPVLGMPKAVIETSMEPNPRDDGQYCSDSEIFN